MILECPNCKKNYRIDPSSFREWKSARIRCRKCGNSFTIAFPATEPPEPPQRPGALTALPSPPDAAGDILSVPYFEAPPIFPPQAPKTRPRKSWDKRPIIYWSSLIVQGIFLACFIAGFVLIIYLVS